MIWSYYLSRYLLFLIFPSVSSPPLELALQWTNQKGAILENGVYESSLEKYSLDTYEEGEIGVLSTYGSSVIKRLHTFWESLIQKMSPQPETSMAWPRYYHIASEALQSFSVPEAKKLARTVLALGPEFSHYRNHPELSEEKIRLIINLTRHVLQNDSLMAAERIWAFGIFLHLKRQIKADKIEPIPTIWEEKGMNRPREEYLSFFLKGKDVEELVQEMWSGFPSQVEPGDRVIQEAIQRESSIHLIKNQEKAVSHQPSTQLQTLLLDFMNLETPISSDKASILLERIWRQLDERVKQKEILSALDETKNLVRLLMHLEEYNHASSVKFERSMKELLMTNEKLWDTIFHTDIVLQLEDERLLPEFKTILRDFTNTVGMDRQQLFKVLGVLHHQPVSSSQLARFFRVVNLVFRRNPGVYDMLDLALNQHPEMISALSEMTLRYGHGNVNPHWPGSDDLRYLIFRKQEDQMASDLRNRLAKILIHQGILSEVETGRRLEEMKWDFCGSRKKSVTRTLYTIFNKILTNPDFERDSDLMEYILYLISLKNDDAKLYRHLINKESGVFERLLKAVSKFSQAPSWNKQGTLDEFEIALKRLEKVTLSPFSSVNKGSLIDG
ncbi:uncharacterized protein MELLADRAFT_65575 [Melampsora larici-populina 98AG31]|uniref:Secreted protein n=1 Tax=Melampsora larici-populina (strain 98AG31 / pathotype 3-4-7) TaxID=747676 RepID=F4RVY0_MELLP|nr:uncharacterized protein MELLADRAFT_65575 [Melampsora larici-populina 98AG31]EGG03506.1 hypothetical protein MELLADRAFT_65575 [Melampsora larici-populina 98AG31]